MPASTIHASAVLVDARAVLIRGPSGRRQIATRPRRLPFEPVAIVGLVVDLAADDAERLPAPEHARTDIAGVTLRRLAAASGANALPPVIAALHLTESGA